MGLWKIGIDSSAGIRGVRSARCKVTINTDLAYRTALCSVTRYRSVVALMVSSSSCTYRGNIRYTSGGADCPAPGTSHLFSVRHFPPLPIL